MAGIKMNKNAENLINSSKCYIPQLHYDAVLRNRLFEKLNQGLNSSLTLVSASAGFGKTTLIASWVKSIDAKVAWLSLDLKDDDPSRFFSFLICALQRLDISIGENVRELLQINQPEEILRLISTLIQNIEIREEKHILVLDDLHFIKDKKMHEYIHQFLQQIIQIDSSRNNFFHVVLISRVDPPYPIAKWRVNQIINEIRLEDLRFSEEEILLFFSNIFGEFLSDIQIKALGARTEGWAAGMQLAAVSLKGLSDWKIQEFIKNFTGDNRYIADYLIEEVLEQQEIEIKDFLLKTSILERLNPDVCNHLLSIKDSHIILEKLEKRNLFLVPLDSQRGWYRYHQLFSDLLQYRLSFLGSEVVQNLNISAAKWFQENQYLEEALHHLLLAKEFEQAANIINDIAPNLLVRSQFNYLKWLIDQFPDSFLSKSAWLNIYLAWTLFILQPELVESHLKQAEKILDQEKRQGIDLPYDEMKGNILANRAICAARRGELSLALSTAPRSLALLPKKDEKVRGLVLYAEATAHANSGRNLDKALSTCFKAGDSLVKGGNLAGYVDALSLAGEIQVMQGKYIASSNTYNEAIEYAKQKEGTIFFSAAMSYSGLGNIYYEWNRLESAFELLRSGCSLGENWGNKQYAYSYVSLALAYLGIGNEQDAQEVMSVFINRLKEISDFSTGKNYERLFKLHQAIFFKEFDVFGQISNRVGLTDINNYVFLREEEWITYLFGLYEMGKYNMILTPGALIQEEMNNNGRLGRWMRMQILLAMSNYKLGNESIALKMISSLIENASKQKLFRSFTKYGSDMLELLSVYRQKNNQQINSREHDYINELLLFLLDQEKEKAGKVSVQPQTKLIDVLSGHEYKVLRLMAGGMTNPEIASELSISVNTVKTHCANIYGKLGVNNRTQAVNRGKLLGLL